MGGLGSGDIWGVVGLVGTALAISISLWLVRRPNIAVYITKWTKIVDDITMSIDGLEVSYKGNKDLRNLVRVTGFVQNGGQTDLDKRDVHEPLTLTLPGDSRWLQVSATSDGAKGAAIPDGKLLALSWDLLRRGERIRFDALFEYRPPDNRAMPIEQIFRASGRIKNTSIRTLREVDVRQRPVLRITTLVALGWLLFLISNVVKLDNESVKSGLYKGEDLYQSYVANDGRICLSDNYNVFWQLVPFVGPPACDIEVLVPVTSMEELTYIVEKAPPAGLGRRMLAWGVLLYWIFSMTWDLTKRYKMQRRHYGVVRWVRMRK